MSAKFEKILSVFILLLLMQLSSGCSSSSGDVPSSAPQLTLNGTNPEDLFIGDTFSDPGAIAMDDVDGNLTSYIQVSSNVDTTVVGDYQVTYSVSDSDGNIASAVRRVVVIDPGSDPTVLNVPGGYATINDALANVADGDTILLAPGTYDVNQTLYIEKNNITIASRYLTTGDERYIDSTLIRGVPTANIIDGVAGQSANLKLVGLSLSDGKKGITFTDNYGEVHYSKFYNILADSVSFDNDAGGSVTHCTIDHSGDDAIDIDTRHDQSFLIAYNELLNSGDDGIEVHLFPHSGTMMYYDIHDNLFSTAREDGIQLIDYDDDSDRTFDIYRNVFRDIRQVGIGVMYQETKENFMGSAMTERVRIRSNYFYNNGYHITGGNNMIILNNIFEGASTTAIHRANTASITDYNLFYNNAINTNDTVTGGNNLYTNPLRNSDFTLQAGSPAIDAGIAKYTHNSEVVLTSREIVYTGTRPDMGRYEYSLTTTPLVRAGYIIRSSEDAARLGDLEAIQYIGPDNTFMIADDIRRLVYQLDLGTEQVVEIRLDSEFGAYTQANPGRFEPLPLECHQDSATGIWSGFCDPEAIAYDEANDDIYLFTGNHPGDLTGFRLSRSAPGQSFSISGWQRIAQGYASAIFINNQFYVSILDPSNGDGKIVPYNWNKDTVGTAIFSNAYEIQDMAYANGILWLLNAPDLLYRIRFSDMQILDVYDMRAYDINDPRGVEVVGNKLYIGDGYDFRTDELKHAIHIFELP